jgi:hypothetical protein
MGNSKVTAVIGSLVLMAGILSMITIASTEEAFQSCIVKIDTQWHLPFPTARQPEPEITICVSE